MVTRRLQSPKYRDNKVIDRDNQPRRCYICLHSASNTTTSCEKSSLATVVCPDDRQYCATVAVAPNFTSSLQCAVAAKSPCSLKYSQQTLQLTCVCNGQLCNAPFSAKLLNDLVNFSSTAPKNISADLTENFLKLYFNFTTKDLYKMITVALETVITEIPIHNISKLTTIDTSTVSAATTSDANEINAPRAEALKQEATEPSDDDEDESEGSGSYEETRSQRQPASAPAAPSSFLPANENKASPLYTYLFFVTSILMYFIV